MNILDIAIAKKLAGGGGGSGTDNYNDLSNLPKINDTTLSGNKSSSALGLQSEINSDSKLASDLVDDTNQDNKFVTSTEKNTWNAKQNAIDSDHKLSSDLVDDANKTNKFVTSTEKQTWNAKQNAIDADHKLSSSLVSFTEAEDAALASGINSSKVGQISTNQTNISYAINTGVRNLMPVKSGTNSSEYKWVTGELGTAHTDENSVDVYIPVGTYNFKATTNGDSGSSAVAQLKFKFTDNTTSNSDPFPIAATCGVSFTLNKEVKSLGVYCGLYPYTFDDMRICPSVVDDSTYIEPSLPNPDLTVLEAEDRASLAEVVDSGAKNLLQNVGTSTTIKGVTFTVNSDGSISTYGTSNAGDAIFYINQSFKFQSGVKYVLSGCPSGGSTAGYRLCSMGATYVNDYGDGEECVGDGVTRELAIYVKNSGTNMGTSSSPLKFYPMICTKAAFGVSNKFVPFGNDPFYQIPINHNMVYRGRNLGATLTDAQHTALSSGNFTDLYLGDYWTKTVTIPAGTYTGGDGEEVTIPAQTNITLKAVIADFDTFYAGYASSYAGINTHHAAVIVTGFGNVVWNKTNSTAGGYVASLIHKWLVGSALPQIETWFGSAKVLSHQKLLTNAITGDAASGWAWSSQKISLLSENQMYGSKVWGGSKATNGGYEPGEAFKHLNVFNHIDANLLFDNKNIWLRDIASAVWSADLRSSGLASYNDASYAWVAPAALILLS